MTIKQTKKGRFRLYDKEGKHVGTKDSKEEAEIEMAKINAPPTSEHDDEPAGEEGESADDGVAIAGEGKAPGTTWDSFFRDLRRGKR